LDGARPQRDNQVYAADEQQRPVDGEAQNVAGLVEVVRARDADGQWPVERGEVGSGVAGGSGAFYALDEAGVVSI
jgi:hypothetical protein